MSAGFQKRIKKENTPSVRILFYSNIARLFRSILIGYLYEISQVFPTILLCEKLDAKTEETLKNKELFPKLEKIIEVNQFKEEKINLLNLPIQHRHFSKLAKGLIQDYKPSVVFALGPNIFESYLRRFAKSINAVTISGIGLFSVEPKEIRTATHLRCAYSRFPIFVPESIKILLAKWRKYLGHVFYYWISPLLVGQKPFMKEPSCMLGDIENTKGADYHFVFSKTDYDILRKNNAPSQKLFILAHPLVGRGKEIFKKLNSPKIKDKYKNNARILTVMWPDVQMGFERKNLTLIPDEELKKNRIRIVSLIVQTLKDWEIFIKPHPSLKNDAGQLQEIIQTLTPISNRVKITDPLEIAEEYIEISDVIVGIPPVSTTIFTASLQCPEKPILSLDFHRELLGNYCKDFNGVEYIDNEEKLVNILELIRDNKYQKESKSKLEKEGFPGAVDFLEHLLKKKNKIL